MNVKHKTNRSPANTYQTLTSQKVKQHFVSIHKEYDTQFPDLTHFLERHLFVATATFNPRTVSTFTSIRTNQKTMRRYGLPGVLEEFGRFYIRMVRFVVGPNYKRKLRYQPTGFMFIDFEGTSKGGFLATLQRTKPHLHGLILVRPEHLAKFETVVKDRNTFMPRTMDSLEFVLFDPAKASLDQAITYAAKGYMRTPAQEWRSRQHRGKVLYYDNNRQELWDMFPRAIERSRKSATAPSSPRPDRSPGKCVP